MREKSAGTILQEWICCKKEKPGYSVEDFALEKYMEFHEAGAEGSQAKRELFQKRAESWKSVEAQFRAYTGNYQEQPELEAWQGAEMLENVILELGMDETERYRYLLNIEMMIGAEFVKLLDRTPGDSLTAFLEQKYQEEWERAEEGVPEREFEQRFSETVSLMQYAGIAYDDENREILAETGVGWQTEFQHISTAAAERDLCFLMNFLISEMLEGEWDGTDTAEEQELMVRGAVPVCVSAVSMIQAGSDASHVMKMAYSFLGKIFTQKNVRFLFWTAAVMMAAKSLFFLLKLAVAGKVLETGLASLWERCKGRLDLQLPEEIKRTFLEKIYGRQRRDSERTDDEEIWEEEMEEFADEEEYEHD